MRTHDRQNLGCLRRTVAKSPSRSNGTRFELQECNYPIWSSIYDTDLPNWNTPCTHPNVLHGGQSMIRNIHRYAWVSRTQSMALAFWLSLTRILTCGIVWFARHTLSDFHCKKACISCCARFVYAHSAGSPCAMSPDFRQNIRGEIYSENLESSNLYFLVLILAI